MIDRRQADLSILEHKREIEEQMEKWIDVSFAQMASEGMHEIWKKNIEYVEGYQVPVGHSSDVMTQYVNSNKDIIDYREFRLDESSKRSKKAPLYFVDNKIRTVIDGMVGDYAEAKKTLSVKADNDPQNDKIEKVLERYFAKLEEELQIWENYRIPIIHDMAKLGLGWLEVSYNPYRNIDRGGGIDYKIHHPKDVGIDVNSKKHFFADARYIVVREELPLKEAQHYYGKFGIDPEKVKPDSEGRLADPNPRVAQLDDDEKYVTNYRILYREMYTDQVNIDEYYGTEPENGEPAVLDEERMYYFNVVYNTDLGVVDHSINKYADIRQHKQWQFNVIPFCNRHSDVKLFPQSDVEVLIRIQDIINITKSLIIDNARDKVKVRALIKKKISEKFPDLWDMFMSEGGAFPIDDEDLGYGEDIRSAIHFIDTPDLPKELYTFITIAEESFRDQSIRNEALQGSYPEKSGYLSGVAVSKLQQANKRLLNFKDTNIEWAINTEARILYRMIALEFKENDFLHIMDAKKGEAKYIPYSVIFNLQEYQDYLLGAFPELPIEEASAIFENENEVDIFYSQEREGRVLEKQEVMENNSLVYINHLVDFKGGIKEVRVKVKFEFDVERNKLEERIYASELFAQGKFPYLWMLKMLGGTFEENAETIQADLNKEQQAALIAEMITKADDETVQKIVAILEGGVQPEKTEKKTEKKKENE